MDPLETLIRDIQGRFNTLTGLSWVFAVTGKEREMGKAPPKITFVEQGGSFNLEGKVGGISGHIGTQVTRCAVLVWHNTREACRGTLWALMLATRYKALGPNVIWQSYDFPTQTEPEFAKKGELMVVVVDLKLPVPAEVVPSADVESQVHSVLVGGIEIC